MICHIFNGKILSVRVCVHALGPQFITRGSDILSHISSSFMLCEFVISICYGRLMSLTEHALIPHPLP